MRNNVCIVDVDGSYLYRKQQQLNIEPSVLQLPSPPLSGWDVVINTNTKEMATVVPRVTPGSLLNVYVHLRRLTVDHRFENLYHSFAGLLYTYLAESCSTSSGHGAFRALQRGYVHWQSGRISQLEINHRHPELCHVCCRIMPSMKPGVYTVYLLLGKVGELATIQRATCDCAAG